MANKSITADIIVNDKGQVVVKGWKESVQRALGEVEASSKRTAAGVDRIGNSLGNLKSFALSAAGVLGVTTSAIGAITWAVDQFDEHIQVSQRMLAAFGVSVDYFGTQAEAVAEYTKNVFDDTAIKDLMARYDDTFEQAGISSQNFFEVFKVAADLSVAKGKSLEQTIQAIVQALGGRGQTLKIEYGLDLAGLATAQERLNVLMQAGAKYAGTAAEGVNSLSGAWASFKNTLDDRLPVVEAVGDLSLLEHGVHSAARALREMNEAIAENNEWGKRLRESIAHTDAPGVAAYLAAWEKAQADKRKQTKPETQRMREPKGAREDYANLAEEMGYTDQFQDTLLAVEKLLQEHYERTGKMAQDAMAAEMGYTDDFASEMLFSTTQATQGSMALWQSYGDGVNSIMNTLGNTAVGQTLGWAVAMQAMQVGMAIISAFQAANLAMATIPPPLGEAVGASLLEMGLANAAIMAAVDIMGDIAGARAFGGPVAAGEIYLVGERGPELFTSRKSGNIIPNDKLGREVRIHQPISFSINGSKMGRDDIVAAVCEGVEKGNRRLRRAIGNC
jgi:hypothetical protein